MAEAEIVQKAHYLWGMSEGQQVLFILVSIIAFIAICYAISKTDWWRDSSPSYFDGSDYFLAALGVFGLSITILILAILLIHSLITYIIRTW
jgi:hypothetical protein